MRVCCYTSFTFAYAARAMILVDTLRRHHPDWVLVAVVVDRHPGGHPLERLLPEFDQVVGVEELSIPNGDGWLFKHDLVEACTAVKGAMLTRLLASGYDAIIYLDPDIALFGPLTEALQALESSSIVLTPHQTAPNLANKAVEDNEMTSLLYGAYNLGFIAVRSDGPGRAFAAWWAARLHRACYDAPERGIFTDQRYVDLVPGLFDGVGILRHPGYNVASWNLSTRQVTIPGDGAIRANGLPLRFFHFTKVEGIGAVMLDRYAGDNFEVFELVEWYKRELKRNASHPAAALPWHFGRFSNGAAIPTPARRLYRSRRDLMAHFDDPFDAGRPDSYYNWLLTEHPAMLGRPAAVTQPDAPAAATG
jgi:hypothetical protein